MNAQRGDPPLGRCLLIIAACVAVFSATLSKSTDAHAASSPASEPLRARVSGAGPLGFTISATRPIGNALSITLGITNTSGAWYLVTRTALDTSSITDPPFPYVTLLGPGASVPIGDESMPEGAIADLQFTRAPTSGQDTFALYGALLIEVLTRLFFQENLPADFFWNWEEGRYATLLGSSWQDLLEIFSSADFPGQEWAQLVAAFLSLNPLRILESSANFLSKCVLGPCERVFTAVLSAVGSILGKSVPSALASAIVKKLLSFISAVQAGHKVFKLIQGQLSAPEFGTSRVTVDRAPPESLALVYDTSGSMGDAISGGGTKIQAAIASGEQIVRLVGAEGSSLGGAEMSLVRFSDDASIVTQPTSLLATVASGIAGLAPQNDTNLGAGLQQGIDVLEQGGAARTLILLSDGLITTGPDDGEVMSQIVPQAVANGIHVYTVGFGDPGNLDEDLLRRIAAATGGRYGLAGTSFSLSTSFVRARQASTGTIVGEHSGTVAAGQTTSAWSFQVAEGQQGGLEAVLVWPGSDMDLVLRDPSGRVVDATYASATVVHDQDPELVAVGQPRTGRWTLSVRGRDLPGGPEPYYVIATTRPGVATIEGSPTGRVAAGSAAVLAGLALALGAWRRAIRRRG